MKNLHTLILDNCKHIDDMEALLSAPKVLNM